MDPFASLQVPEPAPGPSRNQGRPVSVQPMASSASPAASRKRASHSVVTNQQPEEQPTYRDVYAHPAALEYAAAHPRRTIPKFGPYLLLQTLGEGEFGKVKLGLHTQWGEEVAVKLIRRGNIDTNVRMSKVEREIQVLRTLKHPNIVRLYDVIETDKYIGIILEYASGGELFDHILAHRYLREKDACKLFSQLLSGVWYIHQKKIVHRDLKLENLLLDRQRNVIITDFGFANRFEHRADDLMQTSCGSPCYAAPELVISDGLYVGSAVDIWSCGVILYAMLAGYLPFDDDPANPDGDNINLLYKYIVNTPLSFPDYITPEARDLLSIMLVPDPTRRADLPTIMKHRWLVPYAHFFTKSVDDLESTALEQHHQKRLAYQKQMRQNAVEAHVTKASRTHSARPDGYGTLPSSAAPASRNHRHAQPEYLYETPADQSVYQSGARRGVNSAIVMPTPPPVVLDDDPFAPTPSPSVPVVASSTPKAINGVQHDMSEELTDQRSRRESESRVAEKKVPMVHPTIEPVKMSPDNKRNGGFRHTIQVEPPEPQQEVRSRAAPSPIVTNGAAPTKAPSFRSPVEQSTPTPSRGRRSSANSTKPLPAPPVGTPIRHQQEVSSSHATGLSHPAAEPVSPPVAIEVTSPPVTPLPAQLDDRPSPHTQASNGSVSSKQSRHKRGLSIDKIGIGKIFGTSSENHSSGKVSRAPSQRSSKGRQTSSDTITVANGKQDVGRRPSTVQVTPSVQSPVSGENVSSQAPMLSPPESVSSKSKGSRRNTLTVMVEPFRKQLSRASKTATPNTAETPAKEKPTPVEKVKPSPVGPSEKLADVPHTKEAVSPATPFSNSNRADLGRGFAVPASTVKASKVMGWFRSKSKGKPIVDEPEKIQDGGESTHQLLTPNAVAASSSSSVDGPPVAATPTATPVAEKSRSPAAQGHPQRSSSANTETSFMTNGLADLVRRKNTGKNVLRTHHGAVDHSTVTNAPPPDVMKHVAQVLEAMGVEVQPESDFKYRCVRPKRRKGSGGVGLGLREGGSGLAAFTMVGSAASNGVDRRGLPVPSPSAFSATSGILRGLLMRRQSSQVSSSSLHAHHTFDHDVPPESALAAAVPGHDEAPVAGEPVYGDTVQDQGDEVRFSVELTKIDGLQGTYSLDIRRLKGNLRSYKFVYDTLRQRADLQRSDKW